MKAIKLIYEEDISEAYMDIFKFWSLEFYFS